jgi:hypothetical protein
MNTTVTNGHHRSDSLRRFAELNEDLLAVLGWSPGEIAAATHPPATVPR